MVKRKYFLKKVKYDKLDLSSYNGVLIGSIPLTIFWIIKDGWLFGLIFFLICYTIGLLVNWLLFHRQIYFKEIDLTEKIRRDLD